MNIYSSMSVAMKYIFRLGTESFKRKIIDLKIFYISIAFKFKPNVPNSSILGLTHCIHNIIRKIKRNNLAKSLLARIT